MIDTRNATQTDANSDNAAPGDDTLYAVRNVTKRYGDRTVLDVAHLDIRRGEILSIIGPSGMGKSTLLRLLNFLEPPTSGAIHFRKAFNAGQEVPLELRRRVTTVFQQPMLLRRSVEANVGYGLRLRGESDRRSKSTPHWRRSAWAGWRAACAHALRRRAQRAALARAMILQPDALLLDEPTANLDPYNVGLIEQIVARLNREHGTTIVLVTHNVFRLGGWPAAKR